jgi:hypothetical protein
LPTILSSSTSNDASTIPCSKSKDVHGFHILLPPSSSNVPTQLQHNAETEIETEIETTAVVVVVVVVVVIVVVVVVALVVAVGQ